jgi:hypothetical protein
MLNSNAGPLRALLALYHRLARTGAADRLNRCLLL